MVDLLSLGCKLLKNACSYSLHARHSCLCCRWMLSLNALPTRLTCRARVNPASYPSSLRAKQSSAVKRQQQANHCRLVQALCGSSINIPCSCETRLNTGRCFCQRLGEKGYRRRSYLCLCKLGPALRYPVPSFVQLFCCLEHPFTLSC